METNCILQDILWKKNTHLNTYWYLETSLPSLQGDAVKLGTINLFWESWKCFYKMEDRLWKICLSMVRASSVSFCDNLKSFLVVWFSRRGSHASFEESVFCLSGEAERNIFFHTCFIPQAPIGQKKQKPK